MARLPQAPRLAWTLLGWFGLVATLVGAFDIALAWYPWQAGNPAWEFGIINLTVWSLPFPTTGLMLLLASGLALEKTWQVRLAVAALLVFAVIILGALVLYALAIPVALQGAPDPVQLNVRKSVLKTVLLGIAFPTLYIVVATAALRQRRKGA
jgi:hypothetical protein